MRATLTGMKWYLIGIWFAFPWWLVMFSMFSCGCWPSVYLFLKNAYFSPLSIFQSDCLAFWYWVVCILLSYRAEWAVLTTVSKTLGSHWLKLRAARNKPVCQVKPQERKYPCTSIMYQILNVSNDFKIKRTFQNPILHPQFAILRKAAQDCIPEAWWKDAHRTQRDRKKWWFRDQAQLIRSSVHWNAKGDDVSAQGEENQFVTDWITSFCPRSTMPLPIDFMGSSDQSILCHHQLESQGRKEEKGNLYDYSNCAVWDTSLEAIHSAGFFGSWSRWANAGEKFRILARIHSFTHHHISMYLSPLRLYLDGLQIEIYFWVSE